MVQTDRRVAELVHEEAFDVVAIVEDVDGRYIFCAGGDLVRPLMADAGDVEEYVAGSGKKLGPEGPGGPMPIALPPANRIGNRFECTDADMGSDGSAFADGLARIGDRPNELILATADQVLNAF